MSDKPDGLNAALLSRETVPALDADLARRADLSSDPTFKAALARARRALFQQPRGRRPMDDRALLQEVESILNSGLAKSENDALAKVAATVSVDARSLKANTERLRRKLRTAQKSSHENI
ncbi:hypothetical protein [Bradyrhizobium sp. CIR3A]|uniref:hypothetical protein n=1 Tax=Bradyrhizobium sp. CIR3A TaxID=2663838 RepID=UPI0016064200|nr:hypothetical protein [Bradyrhizobium sp. CIR3A]MBB4257293.1 hypothetical protein [Bradyrhizobium sp. CIR3A]